MAIPNILNLIALIIGMAGAYLMYYFTPKISSGTFIYQGPETKELRRKDAYNNRMVRNGMLLLFIGFLLQLVALIVSE